MIVRSKAPLRLGFGGGGTDLSTYCDTYGGFVLNATVSLYVHCTIQETFNNNIVFESLDQGQIYTCELSKMLPLDGSFMDLYKGIYNRLVKEFNLSISSFKLSTYSDVPAGSGLGGSSTLVVAIITAFTEWKNLPVGEYDIARLAFEIEREDICIVGGSQDQYAATFGGVNFMEFYANKRVIVNPLRIKDWILDELEASMVLYFTNITREASQIENEKKSLLQGKDSVQAMHEVKQECLLMKEALLQGKLSDFAAILGASWNAKKRVSTKISNFEIDRILELAKGKGAYSGKLSGAGGGGFMFFMIDSTKKLALINVLNQEQGKVFNFNFTKNGAKGWRIW